MAHDIILYEFPPTRSIRVRWMLQELQVPFEAVRVNLRSGEHMQPEFRRLNPAGKVPVLRDGDLVLTESVAICLYLGEKYPQAGFLPDDRVQRAEVYKWLLFTATELEQPLWRMAKHSSLYPETVRLPAEIQLARADFAPMAAVLEGHMKGREFVVGDKVSVADFVVAYTLDWANEVKLLAPCPTLVAYMERMYQRPRAPKRIAQLRADLG